MILTSAIPDLSEIAELGSVDSKATDTFRIENIVRRAHQIHREHGGFFGYDFEDWVLAWRDLPQTASGKQTEQVGENSSEFVPGERTGTLEPCFGCGN
jgi:hypothetical protein